MKHIKSMKAWVIISAAIAMLSFQASADSKIYYIHNDHLGTPQAVTDENQNVVWQGEYGPFGELISETGTLEQPIRFPGQYADPETGYYYNYYRDYDPTLGRYIQSDPIGLRGGINTYGYVKSNPLRWIDPLGLEITAIHVFSGFNNIGQQSAVWACAYRCGDGSMSELPNSEIEVLDRDVDISDIARPDPWQTNREHYENLWRNINGDIDEEELENQFCGR